MRFLKLELTWDASQWVHVLSDGSKLAWIKLLCYAKASGLNGRVKRLAPAYAQKVWMIGEEDIYKMEQAAIADGALTLEDGDWIVTNWRRYQGDETGAERQKRYRSGRAQVQTDEECHGRNALRNARNGEEKRREENYISPLCSPKGKRTRTSSVFVPPTDWEVNGYAVDIGMTLSEAEAFYDHFLTNGWRVGKGGLPMKDWKAAMRRWHRTSMPVAQPARTKSIYDGVKING